MVASSKLSSTAGQKASAEECECFIDLLNQGKVRAAEKVNDVWEPQPYTIDGVLNYFGTHSMERMEGKYWDKIPLKTANFTDEDFDQGGVRYAPGCMVRTGAYIGPRTVIMNLAFVNIGAHIAGGGGVMANSRLREKMNVFAENKDLNIYLPTPKLSTDNAAMICVAAQNNLITNELNTDDVRLSSIIA